MLSRKGDGKLIKRKKRKDIQALRSRTRRKSSLGIRSVRKSPFSARSLFGKVSLCAFGKEIKEQVKKASLTIEAAFALPLFFFGMVTMIHFMDVYRIQTEHLSKLCQSAKEAGMYAYVVGGDGVEEITLPDVYKYKPIGGLIPLPVKWQYNKVRVHAWTGADRGNGNSEENKKPENMVYVTVSGSVYHKKLNCSHLNLSVTKVSGGNVGSW